MEIRRKFKEHLFDYSNYKSFLKSYFRYRKQLDKNFSFESWARAAKIGSGSYLGRLINTSRHPGTEVVTQLSDYFGFEEKEAEYFENLVRVAKTKKDPQLSSLITTRLKDLNPKKKFESLDLEVAKVVAEWQHLIIREMVQLEDFVDDPEWIASRLRFPISPEKVRDSIERMIELGLLKRISRSGRLAVTSPNIEFNAKSVSEAHRKNHGESLNNAIEALDLVPVEEREFSGTCFNIEKADIPEIREEIHQFRKKLIEKFEKQKGEETMQFQVQTFTYTDSPKESTDA